jgi:3-phosphoshikimate 1-carboxyvinyltransferase
MNFNAKKGTSIIGEIRVPGDKSISHRSIMFGSLAEGTTHVKGFLEGQDALATLNAFRAMGVEIEGPSNGEVTIHGVGMNGLQAPDAPLDMGNSGTSIRLLSGLLAGQGFEVTMIGDESLSKRPMKRVTDPLALMGANVETAEGGTPPLTLKADAELKAVHYDLPMASAQVKSCVLLAGLYANGRTSITEPAPTRDHTERMLEAFGYDVEVNGAERAVVGGGKLKAADIDVPSDISSAAFFMVAAAIVPGSDLTIRHVGMNPTRIGIINILKQMGADITLLSESKVGGEPVADIQIKGSKLKGIQISEADVPLAIDEFPVVFVAAACADGETVLTGAEELRVKESDRIQVMADGLVAIGVDAKPTSDGMIIKGGSIKGGEVESHHDHRISMSFAVASLLAEGEITIKGADNVATSFPNFVDLANSVGFNLEVQA